MTTETTTGWPADLGWDQNTRYGAMAVDVTTMLEGLLRIWIRHGWGTDLAELQQESSAPNHKMLLTRLYGRSRDLIDGLSEDGIVRTGDLPEDEGRSAS